jgi:Asp-tRNA(Asn)/Glu-tRNA(Gln) amidotransferase A subunit family amidase
MKAALSVICTDWKESVSHNDTPALPVLGVPEGPYLDQASPDALTAFEDTLLILKNAGYTIKRISAFVDLDTIILHHQNMISAEMAEVHSEWFDTYEDLYRPRTAALIREGRTVSSEKLKKGRQSRQTVRTRLGEMIRDKSIDLLISPAATGTAPEGISSTGNPAMNLPWTHAGVPTITIPSGHDGNGLPYGLQITGRFLEDESLLFRAEEVERTLTNQ